MKTELAGHGAFFISLSGLSEVTKRTEQISVFLTQLKDGNLFFLITVSPLDEYQIYQGTFQTILGSVHFKEPYGGE
jgi:hypothetical protein